MINNNINKEALREVYEVLQNLDDDSLDCIPEEILLAIENNMDKNYDIDIKKIQEGILLDETKEILCAIYTEYLANVEEKDVIEGYKNSVKKSIEEAEEVSKVGLSMNSFENTNNLNYLKEDEITTQTNLPKVVEENVFKRIWVKIISFFRK